MNLMAASVSGVLLFLLLYGGCFWGYKNYASSDGVLLAVTRVDKNRIRLKLRNESRMQIFFGHHVLNEETKLANVGYRLVCYKEDIEEDFGPNNHSGFGLDPLNPKDEIEFDVYPIPDFKRNCYISVGYYKDEKAVEIIKRVLTSVDPTFTEKENEFLEESKQKVIVTLNINNDD